jgi:hypothetical protein
VTRAVADLPRKGFLVFVGRETHCPLLKGTYFDLFWVMAGYVHTCCGSFLTDFFPMVMLSLPSLSGGEGVGVFVI